MVLVPSLVNPPYILDLAKNMSLAGYLQQQGHDVWLVDWGHPAPEDAGLGLGGHIEKRLLPLLDSIGAPPILVGYCLGGTLSLAAAQLRRDTAAVAAIAAPWDFDHYPVQSRETIVSLWQKAKPLCEKLGYVPMEVLQSGFWALDTARTIRKYAAFADMEEGSAAEQAFIAVEDWANMGAPLTYAAARDLFELLYEGNLTGKGQWTIGGQPISPAMLQCPALIVRSTTDKIVPADASPKLAEQHDSGLGHVGMIVSKKAPAEIWTLLSQWLSNQGG
ncbi:MAG: alpha/beta fold hydrolase [Sphingobium sp.]